MERRQLLVAIGAGGFVGSGWAATAAPGSAGTWELAQAATTPPVHDHAAMMAGAVAPRKYDALIPAYQECTRAAEVCISHCQQLLAAGDQGLGPCLAAALDVETVCTAVLKLAGLNSHFTPALAQQSVAVMQACVEACREHAAHHAPCKACHDACLRAIDAAKAA